MLQHSGAVRFDEGSVQVGRQVTLVFRQERALHPFDDLLGSGEDVRIDVQANNRRRKSQLVEQTRVFMRLEDRLRAMPPFESGAKWLYPGQVFSDAM